jgi:hypothetical protein
MILGVLNIEITAGDVKDNDLWHPLFVNFFLQTSG